VRRATILRHVQDIFRAQLESGSIDVTEATSIDDVPDWDSIFHVQIVVALEHKFDILLEPDEYIAFTTVAEMIDVIGMKLSSKESRHVFHADRASV
jgi:acyl carrier protein